MRSLALALGFAVLLAAAPGASVVPAVAETGAAASASEVRQEPVEPTEDPTDQFIPPDEDEEEEEEDEAEDAVPDSIPTTFPMKQDSILPDSLRSGSGSSLPSGAAPAETLGFKAPGVGADPTKPVPVKPKERGTLFGIHPAAIFAALIAGHILLVGLVTD